MPPESKLGVQYIYLLYLLFWPRRQSRIFQPYFYIEILITVLRRTQYGNDRTHSVVV